jgi:hypothetical protein
MRIKIMAVVTALALAASSILAVSSADARTWRHGYYHGGAGIAGFAAGAILGGVLAAQQPFGDYGDYGYYGYGPGYYDPGYVGDGDAIGYCMSRFKSYDPGSGTYLGYDGFRHQCP